MNDSAVFWGGATPAETHPDLGCAALSLQQSIVSPHQLVPSLLTYPFYHADRPDVFPGLSDKYLSLFTPVVAYWLYSLVWHFIDTSEFALFEQHRIHEPEEIKKRNRVTKSQVVCMVIVQHILQLLLAYVWFEDEALPTDLDHRQNMLWYAYGIHKAANSLFSASVANKFLSLARSINMVSWLYWWGVPTAQFLWASFVMDTYQYFIHRAFHLNKWLYRHIHSWHHRLYCPYAYGALYNHPVEGFLFDSLGGVIAHAASFMTLRQSVLLFGISTLKTVDDHCGFSIPWNPFQMLFGNNVAYHDIHHQQFGIKKNFSQPYFTHWDILLSTRMTPEQVPQRNREKYRSGPVAEVAKAAALAALKASRAAEQSCIPDDASSTSSISSEATTPDATESKKDL